MKTCPQCGMIHPSTAERCECGSGLIRGDVEPVLPWRQWLRYWPLAVPGLLFLVHQWIRISELERNPQGAHSFQGLDVALANIPAIFVLELLGVSRQTPPFAIPVITVLAYYGILIFIFTVAASLFRGDRNR